MSEPVADMSLVKEAIATLQEMVGKYRADQIGIAFNGGKDCCILLHLLAEVAGSLKQFRVIHFESDDEFDEVKEFVQETQAKYDVEIELVREGVKKGLRRLVDEGNGLEAVVLGVRRTDPYCSDMKHFQHTDAGWPALMRVSPLLDWTYDMVWQYIDQKQIPVCPLYLRGYTSLGDRSKTSPNPNLLCEDGSYAHARELQDGDANERLGRH